MLLSVDNHDCIQFTVKREYQDAKMDENYVFGEHLTTLTRCDRRPKTCNLAIKMKLKLRGIYGSVSKTGMNNFCRIFRVQKNENSTELSLVILCQIYNSETEEPLIYPEKAGDGESVFIISCLFAPVHCKDVNMFDEIWYHANPGIARDPAAKNKISPRVLLGMNSARAGRHAKANSDITVKAWKDAYIRDILHGQFMTNGAILKRNLDIDSGLHDTISTEKESSHEHSTFPMLRSHETNLSTGNTTSVAQELPAADGRGESICVIRGRDSGSVPSRALGLQKVKKGNGLCCAGLEGCLAPPSFQSANNEKLPYKKAFQGTAQGWGLPLVLMMLMMLVPQALGLPAVIRIGAIFTDDQRDSATELAFKYAVYRINNDKVILPNTTLVFDIQYVPRDDSFHTAKKACKQITFGVQAIFGPFEPLLGSHIQSITDALDIPHLEARLDMEPQEKEFSINLYPSHQYLNQAYKDMIQFLKWKKVAIVYEEDFGLMKLQEIIRSPPSKSIEIYIRQGHPENYRDILKEVKHKEIYSIIVDTLPEHMNLFLRCLLQLQMNDYRYHYLFTTFDIETFDLEDFKYNFVNMTAFRLVDTDNGHVKRTLRDMEKFQPIGHSILNKSTIIQAEPALIFDSVNVFAKGLHALERSATLSLANLSCESETPWPDGSSLFNYINAVEYDGVTGPIKFTEGKRTNFKLDILKLRMEKLYKVGEWTPESQINITDHQAFFEGGKPNITLKVITIEEKPYVLVRKGQNFTGNARYYGFCIDLLERLAGMTGFDYEIEALTNARYGSYNVTTGEWDGLVRIISDKRADLAVGSMTINYARESVIDFTKPFMNLGVSILFKIPTSQPTRLFSFMNPLAVEIWLYVLAAYLLVSFTMFVMARFSPYEWNNPHPCNDDSDIVENQFTLSNSFWFITGTLLRQGSGLNPKAASTRIVGGIWWFFTLIIISSYTANLAAFLTVERMITPIESAEDLAEQNEIEYGTLEGGSTMAFFRDSKIETYQKMWRYMESKRPSVFVPTIEEGVQRVLRGNYAFLMESTMLDYTIQRNCNLTQVGGLLNSNSYGIATPIGSPWRDKISLAILELQEKGIIQMLYSKWWKNTGDVCNRDEKNKDSKANALGVENIGGVFVVLLCGLALAIVVAILEFCWNSRKNAQTDRYSDDENEDEEEDGDDDEEVEYDEFGQKIPKPKVIKPPQSLCSEMAEELRFAMRCQGSRQRPALKRNCSRCTTGTTYVPAANDMPQANGENGLLPMIEFRKSSVVQFDATSPS
ncbi:glutamate receptor ionotropic, kainate 2-like isoform X1 [Macrobrachium nipponense]|uniref:glutamate receptor ionotropic, kainate 2-like isoform X1 n=2 Tax=Macrobrachium nipponense TaxID=159736 RepID=UPI0030C8A12A